MKNKLTDLNNHLFAQLERLTAEETEGEKLKEEIERSKAVGGMARMIIDNAALALDAQKTLYAQSSLGQSCKMPDMIGLENTKPAK